MIEGRFFVRTKYCYTRLNRKARFVHRKVTPPAHTRLPYRKETSTSFTPTIHIVHYYLPTKSSR